MLLIEYKPSLLFCDFASACKEIGILDEDDILVENKEEILVEYNLLDDWNYYLWFCNGSEIVLEKSIVEEKLQLCPICGKPLKEGHRHHILKTCGDAKCRYESYKRALKEKYSVINVYQLPSVKKKIKQTNLEKYGVENPFQLEEVQEKAKQTNLEKYGVENPFQSEEIKEKIKKTNLEKYGTNYMVESEYFIEKAKQTNLEKYGVENPFQSEEIKEKIKKTNLKKYGVEHPLQSKELLEKKTSTLMRKYGVEHELQNPETKEKLKRTNLERYGVEQATQNPEIRERALKAKFENLRKIEEEYNCTSVSHVIQKYGKYFLDTDLDKRFKLSEESKYTFIHNEDLPAIEEYCSKPHTRFRSKGELEVEAFVHSLGFKTEHNRSLIGKELDVYIPEKHLAIEYNGNYWHMGDHIINKYNTCQEKGIQLLTFYSDEWENKKEICKSIIAYKLGKIQTKIFARKCEIREVPRDEYKKFTLANHIQGWVPATIRLGLYYNNELVQLISLSKSRFAKKNDEIELIRMCTKLNTQVIGGFSKLLKHSGMKVFYSYIDKRLFSGQGYDSCNFEDLGDTQENYFYTQGQERYSRNMFQKHKLIGLFGEENVDMNKTEVENCNANGWFQIFDCGNRKVKFTLEE